MKYYAHFGHKDFILCLGYKADSIKDYFLNYNEAVSNDFVLSDGCRKVHLLNSDINDWKITFVDTGLHSNIGQRLKQVEKYVDSDEVFLANYTDGLTDLPLPNMIDHFQKSGKIASFVSVKPTYSFHVVTRGEDGLVTAIEHLKDTPISINGGYFAFKRDIFEHIGPGEELVEQPFERLIAQRQLTTYAYDGFWAPMDTFKDKQKLDDLYSRGESPWSVWKSGTEENGFRSENVKPNFSTTIAR
jgi:glucose-1-phosphate cytidylyltransferase